LTVRVRVSVFVRVCARAFAHTACMLLANSGLEM
jgi:hypothetical protein